MYNIVLLLWKLYAAVFGLVLFDSLCTNVYHCKLWSRLAFLAKNFVLVKEHKISFTLYRMLDKVSHPFRVLLLVNHCQFIKPSKTKSLWSYLAFVNEITFTRHFDIALRSSTRLVYLCEKGAAELCLHCCANFTLCLLCSTVYPKTPIPDVGRNLQYWRSRGFLHSFSPEE